MSARDELVAIYDEHGREVGSAPRWRMRAEGLWHASTAILLRSTDGERVYVHQRTDTKDVNPGRFDCWAGGVLGAGEDPAECAERELAEELGVSGVPLEFLWVLPFVAGSVRAHQYAYQAFSDGPVTWQPSEVAGGEWLAFAELRARLADPDWPFVDDGRFHIEHWFATRG
ncbi:8-oxo-dGTP pyrophosphatase MutT (NUDIX family) [Crossiella equi]|uniref:8-oxo-dGTP pyrophosphatase MutT (NUDIX family) n=1 Tax=Crossiella equi TaxID=130796 RepID=A0ABS5A811_9PSEU|nr:NUDIX domain-containing protein [Crossiella equi]MBP2472724.1 8-oxo-dGTP pyrophosphatase MutT (NUDIX family) [Crossiella equi]